MLSPQRITNGTAVALAVGAIAAPVASAAPIGGYSRQDKQLTTSAEAGPVTASHPTAPALAAWASSGAAAFHAVSSPSSPAVAWADASSGGFDWGDAGIGAGGLVLSIVAVGGGVVLLQRRTRRTGKTAAVATGWRRSAGQPRRSVLA